MSARITVLLADDDASICTVISQALKRRGHKTLVTDNPRQLLDWAREGTGQIIITDVLMPGGNGLETLPRLKQLRPEVPVIVISAQNTLMTAVKATELGAYDYFAKPFDLNALVSSIELAALQKTPITLNETVFPEIGLVGRSPAMQELYRTIARVTNTDLTVMIEGESGTGKELIARAIHTMGRRKQKAFVALNMAAIPRELVESELFGHEKGAFTGATSRKAGKFAQAQGGTLFLDEIGDMPIEAQSKLLRILQEGEFTPVGGSQSQKTDARIICATHRDLGSLVKTGQFREDLFYRLYVVPIRVPNLSERREDIPELVRLFLKKAMQQGLPQKEFSEKALAALQKQAWPGNVRALENRVYRLVALNAEPVIDVSAVEKEPQAVGYKTHPVGFQNFEEAIRHAVSHYLSQKPMATDLHDHMVMQVERVVIEMALKESSYNQIRASRLLGLNRNTLRKKLTELKVIPHATATAETSK